MLQLEISKEVWKYFWRDQKKRDDDVGQFQQKIWHRNCNEQHNDIPYI